MGPGGWGFGKKLENKCGPSGGRPFVLALDSSTFRARGGGKEIDLKSNPRKQQKENEKKEISFPPPGESQSAQTCFFGMVKKMTFLERRMGMNGVPFGPIGMKLGSGCRKIRGASFGRGPMGLGAGAMGKS